MIITNFILSNSLVDESYFFNLVFFFISPAVVMEFFHYSRVCFGSCVFFMKLQLQCSYFT